MVLIFPPAHINAVVGINNYIFNTLTMINLKNVYALSYICHFNNYIVYQVIYLITVWR